MADTPAAPNWRARLSAQGIAEAEISSAISAAGKLAEAADGLECDLIDTPAPDGFNLQKTASDDAARKRRAR
jgi:hypothetical protein